jgi:hypothetical protein
MEREKAGLCVVTSTAAYTPYSNATPRTSQFACVNNLNFCQSWWMKNLQKEITKSKTFRISFSHLCNGRIQHALI